MATGKKKKKSIFGSVRFCRTSKASEETATIETSRPTEIPLTSLSVVTSCSECSPAAAVTSPRHANRTSMLMTSSMTSDVNKVRGWFAAVQANDIRQVNTFLSRGVDVNQLDQTGNWSALHIASWNNFIDLIQLLVASGCDLDQPGGPGGVTALSLAAQLGHLAAVQLLVGAGCDVARRSSVSLVASPTSRSTPGDCRDVTALHLAARNGHFEVVRCLVSAGASVDARMSVRRVDGLTPLHLAVEAGNADVIEFLIAAGSDVNTRTAARRHHHAAAAAASVSHISRHSSTHPGTT